MCLLASYGSRLARVTLSLIEGSEPAPDPLIERTKRSLLESRWCQVSESQHKKEIDGHVWIGRHGNHEKCGGLICSTGWQVRCFRLS